MFSIDSYNALADTLVNTFALIGGVYGFYAFIKKAGLVQLLNQLQQKKYTQDK